MSKQITLPTINTTFNTNIITINTTTKGYKLALDLNGQTILFGGEELSANWTLSVRPGDVVDVFIIGARGSKSISYTITENGVVSEAERGLYHNLIGAVESPAQIEEQCVLNGAQQAASFWAMLPSRQEEIAPAQVEIVEEQTETVPAHAEVDNANRVLDFGVNEGKKLSDCSEKYLKWAASHLEVFGADHRWVSLAAKAILEARQPQQEIKKAA